MGDDMRLTVIVAVGIAGLFMLLGVAALIGSATVGNFTCSNYGQNTHRAVNYSVLTGRCFVKTSNGWFDMSQVRQNNVGD